LVGMSGDGTDSFALVPGGLILSPQRGGRVERLPSQVRSPRRSRRVVPPPAQPTNVTPGQGSFCSPALVSR
jgi:hypothetical protein